MQFWYDLMYSVFELKISYLSLYTYNTLLSNKYMFHISLYMCVFNYYNNIIHLKLKFNWIIKLIKNYSTVYYKLNKYIRSYVNIECIIVQLML